MRFLIIDHEESTANLVSSYTQGLGHEAEFFHDKKEALAALEDRIFDIIVLDPSPMTNARPIISQIRKLSGRYSYVFLLSESIEQVEAIKSGANDKLGKPIDTKELSEKINNAVYLTRLIKIMGDVSEDFLSAGGIIAKSAFNQLFLSGIERGDRYGEHTSILFLTLSNYKDVYEMGGSYAADFAVAKLCQYISEIRRQSDIIGQTAKNQYTLLLQRPSYETEPFDATKRLIESFENYDEISKELKIDITLSFELVDLPTGARLIHHELTLPS